MLGWLMAAEIFRLVYPAARQGRKVAYLTLAAFIFLLITLASVALLDQAVHPGRSGASVLKREGDNFNPGAARAPAWRIERSP
jgi:hypothetical protein